MGLAHLNLYFIVDVAASGSNNEWVWLVKVKLLLFLNSFFLCLILHFLMSCVHFNQASEKIFMQLELSKNKNDKTNMGHDKQFCRPTWNHYKCQPCYCLFIGREAISIKVFIFGHGATTNWMSNKDRAIWFLVTYMEPPAGGQHWSIYLSMER